MTTTCVECGVSERRYHKVSCSRSSYSTGRPEGACPWCDNWTPNHAPDECPDSPEPTYTMRPAGADVPTAEYAYADALAIGEVMSTVDEAVNLYIELEVALQPAQGNSEERSPTKVHAPSPVNEDTVERRARIRRYVRQGRRLQSDLRRTMVELQAWRAAVQATVASAGAEVSTSITVGPCRLRECNGRLELAGADADTLTCTVDVTHSIPRAMWGIYWDRKVR